jgi:alpha-beta hydrolase superfamily lysophospholipase
MRRFPKSRLARILYKVVSRYLFLCLVLGILIAELTFHPARLEMPAEVATHPERSFTPSNRTEEVTITAEDRIPLKAWYVRPQSENGNAVILIHGISDNRLGTVSMAPLFLREGYRVILPDSRAHGESGGPIATFGLKEAADVHAWVSWLFEQEDVPRCVFGLGGSMGAAILLQALAKESRFCAVVVESPFATFREAAYEHLGEYVGLGPHWFGRSLGRPIISVGIIYGRLRYGENLMNANPIQTLAATDVPVLLIHGESDTNLLPVNSVLLHNAALSHSELWLVPRAQHTGAYATQPQQFETRVLNWFRDHSVQKAFSPSGG